MFMNIDVHEHPPLAYTRFYLDSALTLTQRASPPPQKNEKNMNMNNESKKLPKNIKIGPRGTQHTRLVHSDSTNRFDIGPFMPPSIHVN